MTQSPKKKVVAIVGATNAPGRGLVRAILNDGTGGYAARVVTLDVNTENARAMAAMGAELVVGHIGAGPGLKDAFTGAHGAFCVPLVSEHPSPQRELAEITAIAQSAKDAGLRHVIWATLGEAKGETAKVFGGLGVPTTFLHAFGDAKKLRGERVAEEMGRVAYGILKSGEYIGKTVSINAELLTGERRATAPVPVPASAPPPSIAPKSGSRRALILIPLLLVGAIVAFFVVRASSQPEANLDPSALPGTAEGNPGPPHPSEHAAEPQPPKGESITPTVTSKWEQERAAPNRKIAMAAPPANAAAAGQKKHQPAPVVRYVRSRKRGHSEPEEVAVEASAPVATRPSAPAATRTPAALAARAEERAAPPPSAPTPQERAPASEPTPPPTSPRRQEQPAAAVSTPPGHIDAKAVRTTVTSHASQIRTCYERATMEHADLHGRVAVQATVDPSGHVTSASASSTIENGGRLQACVVAAFESWTFPAPSGGVKGIITYSFSFE